MSSEINLSAANNTHAQYPTEKKVLRRTPMFVLCDEDRFEKSSCEAPPVSIMSKEKLLDLSSKDSLKEKVEKKLMSAAMTVLDVRYPHTEAVLTEEQKTKVKDLLKPGDIVLTLYPGHPGFQLLEQIAAESAFTHAALYEGDGKIIESVGDSVERTELQDTLDGTALIEVIRPPYKDSKDLEAILDYSRKQIGKPYDSSFDINNDNEHYCSELVYWGLKSMPHSIEVQGNEFCGRRIVGPQALETIPDAQIVFTTGASFVKGLGMYSPVYISAAACAAAAGALGGPAGAVAGAALGWTSSILIGNRMQTGKWGFNV